jgi:hypothetical protein
MNPFLNEFPDKRGIPREAARGGAETTYPEYVIKLKSLPVHSVPAADAKK